jgi:hypothetical protein
MKDTLMLVGLVVSLATNVILLGLLAQERQQHKAQLESILTELQKSP